MSYLEIELSVKDEDWSMLDLHSHKHYEIYFLTKGSRKFFLSNALFDISAPSLVVIPPNAVHKTEGGSFERHNVNVSEKYLSAYQKAVLDKLSLKPIKTSVADYKQLLTVIENAYRLDKNKKFYQDELSAVFSFLIFLLSNVYEEKISPRANSSNYMPPTVLKILDFLNTRYDENVTLDLLSEKFFISKPTLIYNFKKYVGSSPIEFLLEIRIKKAKHLLVSTRKSVEEIAFSCGFSSANYFGLIFKKRENLSPLAYRKNQINKL